jgi:hypothetical protein
MHNANQWTPYGWVPLMALQPIPPPPPGLFPYGYPWPQEMQPNSINMGLKYQDNNGSSQIDESLEITAAEDVSVMNEIHYLEVSDQFIISADVHSQSSTMIYQTDSDVDLIPATAVDTSNDASLVLVAKQANIYMVMNCVPDPSQMVKTSPEGRSYDHVTNDGPPCNEKLQFKFH